MNITENPEALPALLASLFGLLVLTFIYLIPTIVARINKKKKLWLTLLLNILFGWTGIGWMILFILALSRDETENQG